MSKSILKKFLSENFQYFLIIGSYFLAVFKIYRRTSNNRPIQLNTLKSYNIKEKKNKKDVCLSFFYLKICPSWSL